MTDDYRPLTEAQLRRSVAVHGTVVGGISVLLVPIWALTTQGYFWPMWPILALSLPLAVHAWTVQVLTRPQLVPPRLAAASSSTPGLRRWSPSSSSSGPWPPSGSGSSTSGRSGPPSGSRRPCSSTS